MAGVAIKQHQFRKQTITAAYVIVEKIEGGGDGQCLANRPYLDAIPDAFTLAVIVVHSKVTWCQRGEVFQFKTQAWVAGTHDAMGDQLVLVAEVAGQTQFRPRLRVIGWVHASRNIPGVGGVG